MRLSWTHQSVSRRRTLAAVEEYTEPDGRRNFADIDVIRVGKTHYASASAVQVLAGRARPAVVRPGEPREGRPLGARLDCGVKHDLNGARG